MCIRDRDNMLLKSYCARKGVGLDRRPAKKLAEEVVEKLNVYTPGLNSQMCIRDRP